MAIPNHVKQNLAAIQADLMRGWQTTLSAQTPPSQGFDGFLHQAVGRARDLMGPATAQPAFLPVAAPQGHGPSAAFQAFMASLNSPPATYGAAEQPSTVAALSAPQLLPGFQSYRGDGSTRSGIIDDAAFFDSQAMSPAQIDQFLRDKRSPFADRSFDGKTAGQLIWETSQQAGDAKYGGNHRINPAMLLAIMGAESSFGRDGARGQTNPFSIRLNGSFDTVKDFRTSLRLAADTMYNWAQSRPADSRVSLFDYAGSHYCEDYQLEWRPNVEKFYRQAMGLDSERMA